MQKYQFDRIFQQMEKEFGIIEKGCENEHYFILFSMESNALKIHRNNLDANSRRMVEAIALVLFDIKGYLDGEKYDTDNFRNEENSKLEKALLMAFDPFTNDEVKDVLTTELDTMDLYEYYQEPIMCLLRIKESVDFWVKRQGADGYFSMLEEYIGDQVDGDSLKFTILKKLDKDFKF